MQLDESFRKAKAKTRAFVMHAWSLTDLLKGREDPLLILGPNSDAGV